MDRPHPARIGRPRARAACNARAGVESLERRTLMASDVRSFDGTGNNLANPEWGSVGEQLARVSAAAYADGVSAPAGADRPSARAVSNAVSASLADGILNDRNLSAFIYVWGQFIDHDMDLSVTGSAERFNVPVPVGDPSFDPLATGTQVIGLTRSAYDPATGTSAANPRQQVNVITSWIDGSMVYGSDATRAAALRTFAGGRLKTGEDGLMPFNVDGLPNDNATRLFPDDELFLAGDVRANENIELTGLHTLWVREHNRIAASLTARTPQLSDEALYQQARKLVVAEIQAITYNEFLPAQLGRGAVDRYSGYDPTTDPSIANEFSTAAFRLGHSLLGDDVEFLDDEGNEVDDELPLALAFFNPAAVEENGIDPILKYLASDRAQEIDTRVVDGVRNFLFGPPGAGGFDLAALNIQRGRDHGLADYNSVRHAYGLPRVDSFDDITSDPQTRAALQGLYGSVDNIDLWVGGLAEDHVEGSSVGELFRTIVADQFERVRDGDRFWYQARNVLSDRQRLDLERLHLSDVIERNTELENLQRNVFFFDVTLAGSLFDDANSNGRRDVRDARGTRGATESGLSGWTVQLLAADGTVAATTTTSATGQYRFTDLDLGTYTIEVVTPAGWSRTTREPAPIAVNQGMAVTNLNYGFARTGA